MERLGYELRGQPCIDFEDVRPENKTILSSRSFGTPVETLDRMREAVSVYTARAAEKMRRQNLACSFLQVFIETNEFKPRDPQYSSHCSMRLPVATADTGRLITAAMTALERIWKPGFRYKKAGVIFLELVSAMKVQGGLFDQPDDERSIARMAAIDALNRRFGRGTIAYGTAGERQVWSLRKDFVSPRYTTAWDELLTV